MLRILNHTPSSLNSPTLVEHIIRATQELLGYADLKTTLIYTPVTNKRGMGLRGSIVRASA